MKKYSFLEYLNSKGKVQNPVVDACADRVDPMTPPSAPKGGKPYGGSGAKKPAKLGKGLADEGDSKLKYTPKLGKSKCCHESHTPSVEQLELATLVADAAASDPSIIETVVSQLKRRGLLGALVGEILEHRATYSHISEVMSHKEYGPEICSRLVRAMSEEVASPFSDQLQGEDDEEKEEELDNVDQSDGEGLDDEELGAGMDDGMGDEMGGEPEVNQDPMLGGEMPPPEEQPLPDEMGGMDVPAPVDPMMGDEMSPAMQHFQRAFQKAYQRAMMSKN